MANTFTIRNSTSSPILYPISRFIIFSTRVVKVCARAINTVAHEAFATFTGILPNAFRWFYHRKIAKDITYQRLQVTKDKTTKVAGLYLFNRSALNRENSPKEAILFTHGDYSHSSMLIHLAKIAKEELDCPVYMLNMPLDDLDHCETSQQLMDAALGTITDTVDRKDGQFKGIIAAGHSMGAIRNAYHAYAKNDPRISKVISIAGRFRDVPSNTGEPCHEGLKPVVNAIYEGLKDEKETKPLHMIVPERDWCVPQEAMRLRDKNCHIIPKAYHLDVIFKRQTLAIFRQALRA